MQSMQSLPYSILINIYAWHALFCLDPHPCRVEPSFGSSHHHPHHPAEGGTWPGEGVMSAAVADSFLKGRNMRIRPLLIAMSALVASSLVGEGDIKWEYKP